MSARARRSRLSAALFVTVAGAAFATSGPVARTARPEHPVAIALGRVAIASVVLFALSRGRALRTFREASPRARGAMVLAGALLGVHFACFLLGLDATSLPAAIALVSLEPLAVVVAAWLVHRDAPTRGEAVGVVIATLGALVVASGAGTGEHRLAGDLLVIAAVALYGIYVSTARALASIPARDSAAAIYLVAAIVLAPLLAVAPARPGSVVWPIPAHAALAIVALALVPTLVGHTAVQAAARTLSPSTVALVSPGETVGGIAIGAIALGAFPSRDEWLGTALVIGGATIAIATARRETAVEIEPAQPPGEGVVEHGAGRHAQR